MSQFFNRYALITWIIATVICSFHLVVRAAEMQGATKITEQVKEFVEAEKTALAPVINKRLELALDMEKFEQEKESMTSLEAANQWIEIAKRFLQMPQLIPEQLEADSLYEFRLLVKTGNIAELFAIIPGPDCWPEIATLCKSKLAEDTGLPAGFKSIHMFISLLTGDLSSIYSDLDIFEDIALKQKTYNEEQIRQWFRYIREEVKKHDAENTGTNSAVAFEQVLASYESFLTEPAIVRAPDLLKIADRNKAETLIKRALSTSTIYLEIPSGEQTRQLGEEIVLAKVDSLNRPQWGMVHSIHTTELFEKLYEKFELSKITTDQDYAEMVTGSRVSAFEGERDLKKRAISFYILGLLAKGRTEDAVNFALTQKDEMISASIFKASLDATEKTDLLPLYSKFLSLVLVEKPELPFWKQFIEISLVSENQETVHNTLSKALEKKDISFMSKQQIKKHLITLLLAQDKISEALKVYKDIEETKTNEQSRKTRYDFANLKYSLAQKLFDLGMVLKQQEISDWGASMATDSFYQLLENEDPSTSYYPSYKLNKLIAILVERNEFSKAEKLILESTRKQIEAARQSSGYSSESIKYSLAQSFGQLLKLYGNAGQYEEVISLLDITPWWNVENLSRINDEEILLTAAKAFQKTGNEKKALEVIKSYLLDKPGNDDGYRILVELATDDIIPWLDKLNKMDRFEERPLMWKGYLLYKSGEYDEAEKAIRQAMSIDPTDGEQKAGQRVHSYSLLADVLEAKGDKENATFFRDVVNSVRIAEEGDLLSEAGLVSRSIDHYQNAMGVFADAYCIQWRLAERLYATGDLAGAREHYKIAFERMPEQFGQVASFCFGCEGAFDKMQSRSAAEEVFDHLLETTPERPQVYFLYGLLRKSQKRLPEAYEYFDKAVKLDPDYLDAWKEIFSLSESVYLSRKEKDKIIIKMLSLDPSKKHFYANISEVVNWVGLWKTLEENQSLTIEKPEDLYPLNESTKTLNIEREKLTSNNGFDYYYAHLARWYDQNKNMSPGKQLSQHEMIATLEYFISLEKLL